MFSSYNKDEKYGGNEYHMGVTFLFKICCKCI